VSSQSALFLSTESPRALNGTCADRPFEERFVAGRIFSNIDVDFEVYLQ
jgi:hypothetical protein